jgi:hypothetical protein
MGQTGEARSIPLWAGLGQKGNNGRSKMLDSRNQSPDRASFWIRITLFWVFLYAYALLGTASADVADEAAAWQLAEQRVDEGAPVTVFVETEKTPGRPAFKIETVFEAEPSAAALTLMQDMLNESDLPSGQQRKILEQSDHEALVYTFIDLPFMLADRELALRIVHSDDATTGVHRIDWNEANEVLPRGDDRIVRLTGARGYWEFRPDGHHRTRATYLSQTEIGGSIPISIGDRLMKGQAVDAVARLRRSIEMRRRTHVAAGPPSVEESSKPE